MSETAHTPTPWTFRIHSDWEDNFHLGPLNEEDGDILHTLLEGGLVLSDEENAANAALIVTAVNALEPTRTALKRAEKELLWASEQFEGGEVLRLAAAECRAALLLGETQVMSSEFARRLRTARAYHDITSPDLARKIGVSRMSVWKYENGKAYPSSSVLVKIGKELKVSLDWLMCGEPLRLECPNGNSLCRFNVLSTELLGDQR